MFLRVDEARALRIGEALVERQHGADSVPAGLLIRDSGSGTLPADVRPKGARMLGQLEWAPCIDDVVVASLRRLSNLGKKAAAAKAERPLHPEGGTWRRLG